MALTGNLITDKKLVRAKRMYQHAVLLATGRPDEMTRIRAVLEFDWVIELTLKALLAHQNHAEARSESLGKLLQAFDTVWQNLNKPALPERGHLTQVRSVRNAAQHEARDPTATELIECQIYTRDFLIAILRDLWGLTLDQVSLAALVQTPLLAQLLQEADQALDTQDWSAAAELALVALTLSGEMARKQVGSGRRLGTSMFRRSQLFISAAPDTSELADAINDIQEILHYVLLGLDYYDYRAFQQSMGRARAWGDGTYRYYPPSDGVTEASTRNMVARVTEIVLHLEQRLSNLDPEARIKRPRRRAAETPPSSDGS